MHYLFSTSRGYTLRSGTTKWVLNAIVMENNFAETEAEFKEFKPRIKMFGSTLNCIQCFEM